MWPDFAGSAAGGTIPVHLNLRGPKIHDHNVNLFDDRMFEWDLPRKLHNTATNLRVIESKEQGWSPDALMDAMISTLLLKKELLL